MKYAAHTEVSVEKSRAEIERTLSRYGATKFAYFAEEERAVIAFEIKAKRMRFIVPMPKKDEFRLTPERYRQRSESATYQAWEQASRQRWRALGLAVKAKLEWVETGIVTIEEEFMPYIVLPGGKTVAETLIPELNQLYATGKIPRLLPETAGS